MITLGIETSCDETALALLETNTDAEGKTSYRILTQQIFSQIDIHAEYGGVFPIVAKREHSRRLAPMLEHILKESEIKLVPQTSDNESLKKTLTEILSAKEPELLSAFVSSDPINKKPAPGSIDQIAVTTGPGLEPTLWVGVNFARALSALWDVPVVAVNHMEGHIVASLLPTSISDSKKPSKIHVTLTPLLTPKFPAIALLISGGHTELVSIEEIGTYKILGSTVDDAVGEAFDKVARMLNIPYPGGPIISQLAQKARERFAQAKSGETNPITLPRPMIHSPDLNFSFSGLKTSVLYLLEKIKKENAAATATEISQTLPPELIENIAFAFEDAVTEVLVTKTRKAFESHEAYTLILGGGVAANGHIRESLGTLAKELSIELLAPVQGLSGDNALMIALTGALTTNRTKNPSNDLAEENKKATPSAALSVSGNLSL